MALRLDRVGRYGGGALGQWHLCACKRDEGPGVLEARRPRPCRPTRRRSGSDAGRRRPPPRSLEGDPSPPRAPARGPPLRWVERCRVAVGKAPASQGICRVKPARDMLHVEAELLDLVEPAREEAVDVPLGAQPRDRLVVGSEREVRKDPRRTGSAAAKQVVSKLAQGVHYREQLEDVRRVGLLGCPQLAALVRHRMVMAVVIRLDEHCQDGHLASIGGDDGAAPRVEGAEDGCSRQALLQCVKARLLGGAPVPGRMRATQPCQYQRSRRRSGGSSCTATRSGAARRWMAGQANSARPRPCAGPLPSPLPRPDGQGSPAPRCRRRTLRPREARSGGSPGFAAALLPRLFGTKVPGHTTSLWHKGATGRVRTGDQWYPALCHCQLGQDIPDVELLLPQDGLGEDLPDVAEMLRWEGL